MPAEHAAQRSKVADCYATVVRKGREENWDITRINGRLKSMLESPTTGITPLAALKAWQPFWQPVIQALVDEQLPADNPGPLLDRFEIIAEVLRGE